MSLSHVTFCLFGGSRPFAEQQLTESLLDNRSGNRSTSLTAPKSRISSQGMGGVGKTMLTAAGTVDALMIACNFV